MIIFTSFAVRVERVSYANFGKIYFKTTVMFVIRNLFNILLHYWLKKILLSPRASCDGPESILQNWEEPSSWKTNVLWTQIIFLFTLLFVLCRCKYLSVFFLKNRYPPDELSTRYYRKFSNHQMRLRIVKFNRLNTKCCVFETHVGKFVLFCHHVRETKWEGSDWMSNKFHSIKVLMKKYERVIRLEFGEWEISLKYF